MQERLSFPDDKLSLIPQRTQPATSLAGQAAGPANVNTEFLEASYNSSLSNITTPAAPLVAPPARSGVSLPWAAAHRHSADLPSTRSFTPRSATPLASGSNQQLPPASLLNLDQGRPPASTAQTAQLPGVATLMHGNRPHTTTPGPGTPFSSSLFPPPPTAAPPRVLLRLALSLLHRRPARSLYPTLPQCPQVTVTVLALQRKHGHMVDQPCTACSGGWDKDSYGELPV